MTPATLRQRLIAGDTVFGTLIVSPSPRWPEVVRGCGLDFVFIDTEHIALDRADLSWMCHYKQRAHFLNSGMGPFYYSTYKLAGDFTQHMV